ncbi:MAG: hypothetical protein ACOCW1_04080, partial [Chitinispirillaceae bacterium]
MRRLLEKLIITLFDLLPKKLSVRSFFIYWGVLPFIIVKFTRRKLLKRNNNTSTVAVKQCSEKIPQVTGYEDQEICIRYSGGTDSTLVAAIMAQRFRKVHLLTFASSYEALTLYTIKSSPKNSVCNLEYLEKRYGRRKFTHTIMRMEKERDDIYFNYYQKHITGKSFLRVSFCPACTMAMHKMTIGYCRENDIRFASDGSCIDSGAYLWQMQHKDNLEMIKQAYSWAGIEYLINPCYNVPDSAEALFEKGILPQRINSNSFNYRRQTQQFCIP